MTPLAKAPGIEDDGIVVEESSVICNYLLDRHGDHGLSPAPGTEARRRYDYWMAWSTTASARPT